MITTPSRQILSTISSPSCATGYNYDGISKCVFTSTTPDRYSPSTCDTNFSYMGNNICKFSSTNNPSGTIPPMKLAKCPSYSTYFNGTCYDPCPPDTITVNNFPPECSGTKGEFYYP
jgi:hypothetical protein